MICMPIGRPSSLRRHHHRRQSRERRNAVPHGLTHPIALPAAARAGAQRIEIMPNGSRPSGKGERRTPQGRYGSTQFPAADYSPVSGGQVTFEPGARTDGTPIRLLIVTAGTGWAEERSGHQGDHKWKSNEAVRSRPVRLRQSTSPAQFALTRCSRRLIRRGEQRQRHLRTGGASTNWHTAFLGQTLIITFGLRLDSATPGEKHRHGATPATAMTHIAIQEALNGNVADWLEKISANDTASEFTPRDGAEGARRRGPKLMRQHPSTSWRKRSPH